MKETCSFWQTFEAGLNAVSPSWSPRQCIPIGVTQVIWPVLGQDVDQECRLTAIFARLALLRPISAAISNNQLVYRERLGARNLDLYPRPVQGKRRDRVGNQEIQVIEPLRTDTECRQGFDRFFAKGRGQKLNHCLASGLAPSPNLSVLQPRHRIEGQGLKDVARVFLDSIPQDNRQPLKAGEIDITSLRQFF